jgi:hypothetical protein
MSAPLHLDAAASFVSPRPRDITFTRTRWRWPRQRDRVQWPIVIRRPTGLRWPLTSPARATSAGLTQVLAWLSSECSRLNSLPVIESGLARSLRRHDARGRCRVDLGACTVLRSPDDSPHTRNQAVRLVPSSRPK